MWAVPVIRAAIAVLALAGLSAAPAQTRSGRDTATAYGARLNARGQPAGLNPRRVNSRIDARIDTRLSLRIERYRPDADPAAAFRTVQDDGTCTAPVIAPPPPVDDDPR